MRNKLLNEALLKVISGIVIVGLMIFLPAGTWRFYKGWIFLIVLFLPMIVAGIIMFFKNPELLKRRLNGKETQKEQRGIIVGSALMFIAGFIIAGIDFRNKWSNIANVVVIVALIVFIAAYLLYGEVLRENMYLSRTVEVKDEQKVIDSGLYSVIRHPMYLASIIMFLSIPLILGSFYSFIIFLGYPVLIVKRIKYEEMFLEKELPGYKEYTKKVKYRLIPHIW